MGLQGGNEVLDLRIDPHIAGHRGAADPLGGPDGSGEVLALGGLRESGDLAGGIAGGQRDGPDVGAVAPTLVVTGERFLFVMGLALANRQDLVGARGIGRRGQRSPGGRVGAARRTQRGGGGLGDVAAGGMPIGRLQDLVVPQHPRQGGIGDVVLDLGVVPVEQRDRFGGSLPRPATGAVGVDRGLQSLPDIAVPRQGRVQLAAPRRRLHSGSARVPGHRGQHQGKYDDKPTRCPHRPKVPPRVRDSGPVSTASSAVSRYWRRICAARAQMASRSCCLSAGCGPSRTSARARRAIRASR
ncbi:Uncharacterised protein [Mycobacteroides abscessus subsp. abscessus]|nr:Uncharacterised protein [Mycobacteroides abscessus subsp. abscessus]